MVFTGVNTLHVQFVYMYGLLTKREVKRAEYYTLKKTRPICTHVDRASLVNKGFIICDKTPKHDLCTCRTKPVSRAGKIAPSCPLG